MQASHARGVDKSGGKKRILSSLASLSGKFTSFGLDFLDNMYKKKLKVALISYYYKEPTLSGVGIHMRNLAKALSRNGCEVHVFCKGEEDSRYSENNVVVHSIGGVLTPLENNYSKKRMDYDLFESEVIRELTRENTAGRFDILHTHGALTKSAFILKKVYDIKWVHTFHAVERRRVDKLSNEEKQFKDLISWIESTVNYCDGAIFVSSSVSEESNRYYKLKSRIIIPNGVDLESFHFTPLAGRNVLFIGRFSKEKGILIIPDLISRVMSIPDASVTVVCPYMILVKDLRKIKSQIDELGARFPGRVNIIEKPLPQHKVAELYRKCSVYIQPSTYESFGLCIIEAMATGRPVVAFRRGGIPEVIGDAGVMVENKENFISKVAELLKDPVKARAIGKKAYKRAKLFSWDIVAKKTILYYKEILR